MSPVKVFMLVLVVLVLLMSDPSIVTLYITGPHTLSGSLLELVHDIVIVFIPILVTVIKGVGSVPVNGT